MVWQSLLALALAIVTVILHAVGTVHLVIPITGVWRQEIDSHVRPRPVWTLTRLVGMLLVLHMIEMAVWAAAYTVAGVFGDFETSLYFSQKSTRQSVMATYCRQLHGDCLAQLKRRSKC